MFFSEKRNSLLNDVLTLSIGTGISVLLLIVRYFFSQRESFLFLTWNIFLAWVPCIISLVILSHFDKLKRHNVLFAILFVTWLLFFPNAAYILTDLIHVKHRYYIPMWYDMLLIGSFAVNGLIIGLYSLSHIHQIIKHTYGHRISWAAICVLMYLNGLGVYLGRVLRWNSWDIATHPVRIVHDLFAILNPFRHPQAVVFTASFSLGTLLFYIVSHLIAHKSISS